MKFQKKILVTSLLSLSLLFSVSVFAGDPPPGPGGDPTNDPGSTPIGGGAPIGGGVAILVALGTAYGARKTLQLQKEEE